MIYSICNTMGLDTARNVLHSFTGAWYDDIESSPAHVGSDMDELMNYFWSLYG